MMSHGFSPARCRFILLFAGLFSLAVLPLCARTEPDARDYYVQGMEELSHDNPYASVDAFRSALRLNPAYADAYLGMASALFQLMEYAEAAKVVDEARKYAGESRELALLEARILTALRRYDEAAALYGKLLKKRPHDAEANRGLAEIYALTGQSELAEEWFGLALRQSPGDRRSLLQLALLYDEERNMEKGDAAIQEALRIFPDNPEVRIRAAEHYALYNQWETASMHLSRARSMLPMEDKRRYRVELLDAELALENGAPSVALGILQQLSQTSGNLNNPALLYLMARAYRDLNEEELAQQACARLLRMNSEDEITRMFREEFLFLTAGGFQKDRREAAGWHLARGRRYEENFYYRRAYDAYRRARLVAKDDAQAWLAYTSLLRKMGFTEHYKDSLRTALMDIPSSHPDYPVLKRRLSLLEHSKSDSLEKKWNINDAWTVPRSAWKAGVYVYKRGHSLPEHTGSQKTLALYFSDILDSNAYLDTGTLQAGRGPAVEYVDSFSEAFRKSRGKDDYFMLLSFAETPRTFSVSCELYLSRSGKLVGRFEELRTGQGRVVDALYAVAESISSLVPRSMGIIAVEGNELLLDKGRWHGVEQGEEWIVLRQGSARPSLAEGGIDYADDNYLGSVTITDVSEPVSTGLYKRQGDFNFLKKGDMAYFLPVPEELTVQEPAADPAFRSRLLSIP